MSNPYKVLVIVPAYNEAESICATVKAVIDSGYDYVVVNDGSTDNTLEICHANHLNVLDLPQNLGIGGAVQAGHKYAKKYGYNIDVQVDGDGQHDPCFISSMVEQIEAGYDLVIGSRFLERTGGFQSTFLRRVGISWLTRVIKMCTGKYIADPTCHERETRGLIIHFGLFECLLHDQSYPCNYYFCMFKNEVLKCR